MKKLKYVLGLDLGVASIGWAAVELDDENDVKRIVDVGARVFKALDNDKGKLYNEVRREKRGLRRIISRRKERLRRIYALCKNQGLYDDKSYIFDTRKTETIYDIKLRGLEEKLTGHELTRCLIHYAKNRGFKSNRKAINEEKDASKIKASISKLNELQEKHDCTITKAMLVLKNELNSDTLKNTSGEYIYFYDRASIEKEATMLLDKQMEYNVIDEQFKNQYLEILLSQRDFSEGPAEPSKYNVDFERLFGECKFTKERRISRVAPSYELFVLLQNLVNFRYYAKEDRKNKLSLTKSQIQEIYNRLIEKPINEYKYANLVKDIKLDLEKYDIVNLPQLTKKQYSNIIHSYLSSVSKKYEDLDEDEIKAFNKKLNDERIKIKFAKLNSLKTLSTALQTNDLIILDAVGELLTFAKTDNKIEEKLKTEYQFIPEKYHEKIKEISLSEKDMKGSGMLSLSLTRKVNELFLEGNKYSEALEKLGFNHSAFENHFTKFPTVEEIQNQFSTVITSPNVKHVLVMLRKLYNAIVQKYGIPTYVRIELAREMNKSFSERNNLINEQLQNRVNRLSIKNKLATLCNLNDRNYFSNDDILRYELYEEQNGICVYSGEVIKLERLLSGDYEIDHILPYSKSYDDSKLNKVLVVKKANQSKGNRVPLEWLTGDAKYNFEKRVTSSRLPSRKKEKLLVKQFEGADDFTNRDFAVTSHISRIVTRVFENLISSKDGKRVVQVSSGGHTSSLRYYMDLNDLTHSLISKNYSKREAKVLNYKITNFEVFEKSIKFTFENGLGFKVEKERKFLFKKNDDTQFINMEEENFYFIVKNKPEIISDIVAQLQSYKNVLDLKDSDIFPQSMNNDEIVVREQLNKILIDVKEQINKKDRTSHFHHMVDAVLIACLTDKMKSRISKHRLHTQIIKERFRKEDNIVDYETGEKLTFEQYLKLYEKEFKYLNKKLVFNLPYDTLRDEIAIRIFERDNQVLHEKISLLPNYKDVDIKDISVRYPSHYYSKKVSGTLHAETLYGMVEGIGAIKKVSVFDLNSKNLELLYDKEQGSKVIYETLKEWLKTNKKTLPILENGRPIKKVKLIDENINKFIPISASGKTKAYAGIGEIARILVLKKNGEDNLYFAQIDNMRYLKFKNHNYDFNIVMWKAQGEKNSFVFNYKEILENGWSNYCVLIPGEIVRVVLKKDNSAINCKIVGFTSGTLEVGSIIGDNLDLNSSSPAKKQQKITVSTIASIHKISIDLLGNLENELSSNID